MDDSFHVAPSLTDECVADARAAVSQVLPNNAISDEDLSAPTFEVLHRLVAAVIVRTGFASTLYTSSELAAATSSAAGASDFVDRIVAVLGVCEGEPIDLQLRDIVVGYGADSDAPLGFSTFCMKLCGTAANATVDHAAAVQRALSGQPPDPMRLPRLTHQAVLSVTVLDAADLPSSTVRAARRPSTLAWLSGGSGDGSKSSGGPVVEVWVSSTKNPSRRKVTKPGQRSANPESQANSNDASGPTFVFVGTGQGPGSGASGTSVFSFPVPKPHEEHLLLSVHMSPDAGGAAGSVKPGSLPLVGRGQLPLSHVSSVAHDLEVPLVTNLGGYGGTVRVRACLRALSDPSATDRAVFNDGANTFISEREAALIEEAKSASLRPTNHHSPPAAAPPQSLGSRAIRPSVSGSTSDANSGTSSGNGGTDGNIAEDDPSPKSGVVRFFGGMRSKSLKSPTREDPTASSAAAGRRSSMSFFGSSSSTATKNDKNGSDRGPRRRSDQFAPDSDDEMSAELTVAADDVARRVAASAKRKLAQGIVSREEYECIMAQNQALYESETSDATLGLASSNSDETTMPQFAAEKGSSCESKAGGRTRATCSSIDRTHSSQSSDVSKLAVSDAWEVFGEGNDNDDEMGMYLAPSAVEVLSPRDISRRYTGGDTASTTTASSSNVAFDSASPYETSGAAREQKMPANEIAQLKSMGFDPVAVDAAAEVYARMDLALPFLVDVGAASPPTSPELRASPAPPPALPPAMPPLPPTAVEAEAVKEALTAMGFAAKVVQEALANGCRSAEEAVAWCLEQPRDSLHEEPPKEARGPDASTNMTAGQEGTAAATPAVVITSTLQDLAVDDDDEDDLDEEDVGDSVIEVGDDLSYLNLDPSLHPSSSLPLPTATATATTTAAATAPVVKFTNVFAMQFACYLGHPTAAIELANRAQDGLVHVTSVNEEALACGVQTGDVLVGLSKRLFGAAPPPQAPQVANALAQLPKPWELRLWRDSTSALAAAESGKQDGGSSGTILHLQFGSGGLGMELEAQSVARVLPASSRMSDDSNAVCLVVTSVKADGQGQALKIQVNDVIVGLNGSPLLATITLAGFAAKLKKLKGPPCLSVWRPPFTSAPVPTSASSVSANSALIDTVENQSERKGIVSHATATPPADASAKPVMSAMAAVEAVIETADLDEETTANEITDDATFEELASEADNGKITGTATDGDASAEATAALVGMGFTPAQAAESLSAAGGDFDHALEACILATQSPLAAPQPTVPSSSTSSLSPPPKFALEPVAATLDPAAAVPPQEATAALAASGMSQDPAPAGGLVRAASAFAFESGGGGVTFTVSLDAPLGLTLTARLTVTHAMADSAAALSGCGVGCVVVAVGGAAVSNPIDLRRELDAAAAAGRNAVEITFARNSVDLDTARESIAAILNTSATSSTASAGPGLTSAAAPITASKSVSFFAATDSSAAPAAMSYNRNGGEDGGNGEYLKPRREVAENLQRHDKRNPVLASNYGVKVEKSDAGDALAQARRRAEAGVNGEYDSDDDDFVDAEVESDEDDGSGYIPARAPGESSRGSLAPPRAAHGLNGSGAGVATARANAAAAAGLAPGSQAQYYAPPQQKPWAIVATPPAASTPPKPADAAVPVAKKGAKQSVLL